MDIDGNIYCPRCMRRLADTDPDLSACPLCGREPGTRRPPAALDTGTLLAGRYQLGDVIGQGGFGITYAAWDETLGMPVAVKEYFPHEDASRNPEISDDLEPFPEQEARFADGLARFRRESNLLASLQGIPCVVKVLDYFSENKTAYIVMEFVHGMPIDRWVRENNIKPAVLLDRLRPVFDALVRTHSQGVIHRDITPDNILVGEDGSFTLIDFGSAVEVSRNQGTVLLTRRYAPVEQYSRDNGQQGPWTDVYSLAAVLYTLFSGQEPVESPLRLQRDEQTPLSRMHTGLKSRQAAAVDRALVASPEKRTQSMAEFRAAMYNLPMPEEVIRRKRFMRRVITAAAVLLVLLSAVVLNFTTGLPIGGGLLGSVRCNGIYIVRQLSGQEEVSVPESVLGIPVSGIGSDAFRGDEKLRTVHIPGTVNTVGDSAFYNCEDLQEAHIDEGVESIGISAFGGCGSLLEITLPSSLTGIGDNALPASAPLMTVWGSRGTAAEQYANAQELRFADASELTWEIRDGSAVLTSIQSEAARLTLPNYVDGAPVTAIQEGIRLTTQEEVWLPEYLEIVTPHLFQVGEEEYNKALRHVRLGSYVREIGAAAFYKCLALNELALPSTLEQIDEVAFFDSDLKELTLPERLRNIGYCAFSGTKMTHIDIPSSVESIGTGAFEDMNQLSEVTLPDTIQDIPIALFARSGIHSLIVPEHASEIKDMAFVGSDLQWIVLPEGMRKIGDIAFDSCKELRFILIPASVDKIEDNAFDNCPSGLIIAGHAGTVAEEYAWRKGITFENIDEWTKPDEFKMNGETAVYLSNRTEKTIHVPLYNESKHCLVTGCECHANSHVKEVILSPFQTVIEEQAFMYDTALRWITAAGEIREIGSSAFSDCYSLIIAPSEKITRIESWTFEGCSRLDYVFLDNAEYIGFFAFSNCSSLQKVWFSDRLSYISSYAFESCTSLQSIVLPAHLREMGGNVFEGCSGLQLIVFSEGATVEVTSSLLGKCTNLRSIYLSSTIPSFSGYSWREEDCPKLHEIWFFNPNMEMGSPSWGTEPAWIVHGYAGSTAQTWAEKYNLSFEPIPDGMKMPDPQEIVDTFEFAELGK